MVTLLVVEHPPAVRRTLCTRLSLEPDLVVVGEADDALSAAALAETHRPEVVLLDAEMPHLDIREAVRQISERSPTSAYVVLSLDAPAVVRTLGAGTAVYVGKHERTQALVAAIRRAAASPLGPACRSA